MQRESTGFLNREDLISSAVEAITMKSDEINTIWREFANSEKEEAFYKLYRHYYHYLSIVGLKKGFDAETVKDSIHQVFLQLWEKRSSLGHISNPHSYLITVFLRKVYRQEKLEAFTNPMTDLPAAGFENLSLPSVEEQVIDREKAQRTTLVVQQYLEQLPPRQREIIYQKYFLGLSYQEIADASGLSTNTVYNTVYSAMDKLRSLLPRDLLLFLFSATVCANNF
jgi:RNA polymerase sigma factor (sigma-70 family)